MNYDFTANMQDGTFNNTTVANGLINATCNDYN